jgi:hypothetical protein
MRTLFTAVMDVAASNKALMDGSLPKLMESTMEKLQPEAAYFTAIDGCRACMMVFDLKDTSEIPGICEPFFHGFNAKVTLTPVMNREDLQKGIQAWQSSQGK